MHTEYQVACKRCGAYFGVSLEESPVVPKIRLVLFLMVLAAIAFGACRLFGLA